MRRKRTALLTLLLLIGLIAVPVVLTWREVRQEQLNHALIAAVDRNEAAGVRRLLRQGADPNAQVHTDDKRSLWKQVWDRLRVFSSMARRFKSGQIAGMPYCFWRARHGNLLFKANTKATNRMPI
jgi:hypothetical protein